MHSEPKLKLSGFPQPFELSGLDLSVALNLLHQAGYGDETAKSTGLAGLQTIIDRLCDISLRDGLTGLANSRHFTAALERELDRVSRSGEIALLLLIDLDHFKGINDTFGHPAGDRALCAVAEVLRKHLRPMDTAARYGGDEFAVILPNCRPGAGRVIAERIREQVEGTPIRAMNGTEFRLTLSMGGAHVSPWRRPDSGEVLKKADEQLYVAKASGRNRIAMDMSLSTPLSTDEMHQLLDPIGHEAGG